MYFVYVISSNVRKYIYVGITNNTQRRIGEHQKGKEKTTRPYRPFSILHIEVFSTRIEARKREKYLKSGSGKEWIKRNFLSSGGEIGRRASLRG
ncbi:MAG: GIY-YIG nuclease family protein [Candidatus Magasanikbacteria bacterium]